MPIAKEYELTIVGRNGVPRRGRLTMAQNTTPGATIQDDLFEPSIRITLRELEVARALRREKDFEVIAKSLRIKKRVARNHYKNLLSYLRVRYPGQIPLKLPITESATIVVEILAERGLLDDAVAEQIEKVRRLT